MNTKKNKSPKKKSNLHPRNKHQGRYDFAQLIASCPALALFVKPNVHGDDSVDFFNPEAVKTLNQALLAHYYGIAKWDIPKHYLCPPIPGRADYIHYLADLLGSKNKGHIPTGNKIKCLDIGVGANCIYPIIGIHEYDWSFIGADIDPVAIQSANKIIKLNPILHDKIEIRLQVNPNDIFQGVLKKDELIDISLCNPPFHASLTEARSGTLRKLNNLTGKKTSQPVLNFGGQNNELHYPGGEKAFIREMIHQSKAFASACFWFSSLIAKQESLKSIYTELNKAKALEMKTVPMSQGNKISRFVAWTFLSLDQQETWAASRWNGNKK
ncbi:MAG: 23S rRNA (adenine(1618)-N(6))-methyltransferase RlmF [Gammaproteobacteria bacterium]|nr:23S rRNA (adenine(1618)-N(6))-methyltransferase RlmF [Gammaproteobacteria bacterium]